MSDFEQFRPDPEGEDLGITSDDELEEAKKDARVVPEQQHLERMLGSGDPAFVADARQRLANLKNVTTMETGQNSLIAKVESVEISQEALDNLYNVEFPKAIENFFTHSNIRFIPQPSVDSARRIKQKIWHIENGAKGTLVLEKRDSTSPHEDDITVKMFGADSPERSAYYPYCGSGSMPVTEKTLLQVLKWELDFLKEQKEPVPRNIGIRLADIAKEQNLSQEIIQSLIERIKVVEDAWQTIEPLLAEMAGRNSTLRSELQNNIRRAISQISRFGLELESKWPLSEFTGYYYSGPNDLNRNLTGTTLAATLDRRAGHELLKTVDELSNSVHQYLDPKRSNLQVQGTLDGLLKKCEITQILPRSGSQFHPQEHNMIGSVKGPPDAESRTIAEVREVGLIYKGKVAKPAQVILYQ